MIRHQLTYGSIFTAVEYSHNTHYNVLSLKKKKQELTILQKEQYTEEDALFAGLKSVKHVFLIVNHEQVLTKDVSFTHIAKESVVKAAFPNISLNDFYYDVLDHGASSLVSICRKEVVDNLIEEFRGKGISIVQFSLGETNFKQLLPFLNDFDFHTSRGLFEVSNHEVVNWQKSDGSDKKYDVNGLIVESNQLLPLAGVISYCNGLKAPEDAEIQKGLIQEYSQKRIFQLGVRIGLGFLLIALLVNFFVFSSYRNQDSDLREELSMNEVYKKQLLSLNDLVSKKKRLVESMNSVSNSKVIWYFDQIAQSVPNTVSLDNIHYQPTSRSVKKDKPIQFKNNEVVVAGLAKDDTDFTLWVSSLEKIEWIEKISKMELDGEKSRYTSFDFIIHLKPETP
jgi:hypothetical protein